LFNDFLINGSKSQGLNPFDRGLAFGDGVFRTFKVFDHYPRFWEYHYLKLKQDAKAIDIDVPSSKILINQIRKLFNEKGTYIGKFIITRGLSDRGYQIPSKRIKPNCILLKTKFIKLDEKLYSSGVHIELSPIIPSTNLKTGSIKHLNRLENVLLKKNLSIRAFDGLMINEKKYALECGSHNIFLRFKNTIVIPNFNHAGVAGISQMVISDFAMANGYNIKNQNISLKKVEKADEFFIANSVNGLIPVRSFNKKQWKDFKFVQEFRQSVNF